VIFVTQTVINIQQIAFCVARMNLQSEEKPLSEESELARCLADPVEREKLRKTAAEFGLEDTLDFLLNLQAEKTVLQSYEKYAVLRYLLNLTFRSISETFGNKNWTTMPKHVLAFCDLIIRAHC
jgi:hypothetical protein